MPFWGRSQGATMNGTRMERDLMAVLRGHGFRTMRSPGSGTGDFDQPDVMAGSDGVGVVIELKSGANPKNVRKHEVDALQAFADDFMAAAMIGVRYKGDRAVYLVQPEAMSRTPSGHYSIPKNESDLPWDVCLPYTDDDDGVIPLAEVGNGGVIYPNDDLAVPDPAPTLRDWLDAMTAAQQGFAVRRGIVDMATDDPTATDTGTGGDD